MQFAKIPHAFAFHERFRASARVQERLVCSCIFYFDMQRPEHLFDCTFKFEIVSAVAVFANAKSAFFIRQFFERKALWQVYVRNLEKSCALVEMGCVVYERFNHTVRKRRAHNAECFAERIFEPNCVSCLVVLVEI